MKTHLTGRRDPSLIVTRSAPSRISLVRLRPILEISDRLIPTVILRLQCRIAEMLPHHGTYVKSRIWNTSHAVTASRFANLCALSYPGPHLWNVVDREKGSYPDPYSDVMRGQKGHWTFEELNRFLSDPTGYVPGTNMDHGHETDRLKRLAVIVYLNTFSDNPLALK